MTPIEAVIAGKWSLLIEEAAYDSEAPILLRFSDGIVSDGDSQLGGYRVEGNTVFAPLGENAELVINPGDRETGVAASELAPGATSIKANLHTSFDDGSDELVEYATLVREA